jgi:hypothetical protein
VKRREFISLLGGAAAAWPLAARAQQGERVRRIGVLILYSQTDREGQARIAAFLDTVRRLGWTDGRNVRIEYRWSAGDIGREKGFAAELVRATPDAIVVSGWTGLAELKRLTSVIPIVLPRSLIQWAAALSPAWRDRVQISEPCIPDDSALHVGPHH